MTIALAITITLIYLMGAAMIAMNLRRNARSQQDNAEESVKSVERRIQSQTEMLAEIERLKSALVPREEFDQKKKEMGTLEESLRTERGRVTITEAELEALEGRLREFEEIERELQASTLEIDREIEMLRSQEKEVAKRNEELRVQLETTLESVGQMLAKAEELFEIQDEVERVKAALKNVEQSVSRYTEDVSSVNKSYVNLKRAYDALDIEYAQIYEKQNELEAARGNS